MRKVYKVTFNNYKNLLYEKTAITNSDETPISETLVISDGTSPTFLIFEDEIEYYRHFGNGIKSLELVGCMIDRVNLKGGDI